MPAEIAVWRYVAGREMRGEMGGQRAAMASGAIRNRRPLYVLSSKALERATLPGRRSLTYNGSSLWGLARLREASRYVASVALLRVKAVA